jgi:hypothetical protein
MNELGMRPYYIRGVGGTVALEICSINSQQQFSFTEYGPDKS